MALLIRKINGKKYAYLVKRIKGKVVHQYLGPVKKPEVREHIRQHRLRHTLPQQIRRLFNGAESDQIDIKKNAAAIIERIIEAGRQEDLMWALFNYPVARILEVAHEALIQAKKANKN